MADSRVAVPGEVVPDEKVSSREELRDIFDRIRNIRGSLFHATKNLYHEQGNLEEALSIENAMYLVLYERFLKNQEIDDLPTYIKSVSLEHIFLTPEEFDRVEKTIGKNNDYLRYSSSQLKIPNHWKFRCFGYIQDRVSRFEETFENAKARFEYFDAEMKAYQNKLVICLKNQPKLKIDEAKKRVRKNLMGPSITPIITGSDLPHED